MKISLLGNKYGFITGTCTKKVYREKLHKLLEMCNMIVLSCLMNTVSEHLLSEIVYTISDIICGMICRTGFLI